MQFAIHAIHAIHAMYSRSSCENIICAIIYIQNASETERLLKSEYYSLRQHHRRVSLENSLKTATLSGRGAILAGTGHVLDNAVVIKHGGPVISISEL